MERRYILPGLIWAAVCGMATLAYVYAGWTGMVSAFFLSFYLAMIGIQRIR